MIKKVKNTVPQTYVINDLNGDEIIRKFNEEELKKTNQQEFRIEKVIKRKGYKLYVKWKDDSSFNMIVHLIVHLIAKLMKKSLIK